jgi:hypothetical protein
MSVDTPARRAVESLGFLVSRSIEDVNDPRYRELHQLREELFHYSDLGGPTGAATIAVCLAIVSEAISNVNAKPRRAKSP